jgi:hypothetical protein
MRRSVKALVVSLAAVAAIALSGTARADGNLTVYCSVQEE